MNYVILISVLVIALVSIGGWFAWKFLKKKQEIALFERTAPKDILDKFNEAEEKMKGGLKEDGTTENPYKILWEIARGKPCRKEVGRTNSTERSIDTTESVISNRELHKQPSGRQDVQTRDVTSTIKDQLVTRKPKPNNLRRIISRVRGKSS